MNLDDLRFPIGKFNAPQNITAQNLQTWIAEIENLPQEITDAVAGLTDEQLDTPYRPEGWTLRQVIHHLPDSHMNSYIRFKWTLTENSPTIKAYDETLWAELPDGKTAPIALSLHLLTALHARWVVMLKNLDEGDLGKKFTHPANGEEISLKEMVGTYAWHGRHHLGHITSLKERMGW